TGVWRLVLALLVTYGVVELVLKPTLARDRPPVAHAGVVVSTALPGSFSFPSGHAASAAAGAFALSRIWPSATPALWMLALLIGASRVYLGVHYPLDVVAGLLIGLGCAYVVTGGMVYEPLRRGRG
ncbi:MAG: phosphatase PAP2 family protein, partial [Vicinamibacterales bacterium]